MFAGVPLTEDKTKKLEEAFEFFNTFLAGSEFAAGGSVSLADISLIASVTTIQVIIHFVRLVAVFSKL